MAQRECSPWQKRDSQRKSGDRKPRHIDTVRAVPRKLLHDHQERGVINSAPDDGLYIPVRVTGRGALNFVLN